MSANPTGYLGVGGVCNGYGIAVKRLTEFDEGLWGTLVDFMTVYSKDDISVTFKDGTEIHIG